MKKITLSDIENAFLPSKEITDADKFAGRETIISMLYSCLISKGNNIAIIGNRGIGKTSMSRQLYNVATGKNEILKKVNQENEKPLDFLSIYYACGENINNISDLLRKLLTTKECLSEWVYDVPAANKEIQKLSGGFDVGFAKTTGNLGSEKTSNSAITQHDIDVIFSNVISSLISSNIASDGILIIIDEYDQIKDSTGFAGLIKAAATNLPKLKFCIVGVAQDLQNLMKEHESSDRLFAGGVLYLPPMNKKELIAIIKNAEISINNEIKFLDDAVEYLVTLAQGHPYIVHLIGKYSLRTAYKENIKNIDSDLINKTLLSIAQSNADPILEGRYKKAVGTSQQREIVLKTFANTETSDGEIFTKDTYKQAIDKGVDNPSQYVGQLVVSDYGEELVKVRESYYRFKDSLFKAYVKARPYLFQ